MVREAFGLGALIVVTEAIDLAPLALVSAGETGVVTYVDHDETAIRLDTLHRGLLRFHNEIWIIDGCDDVLDHIRLLKENC